MAVAPEHPPSSETPQSAAGARAARRAASLVQQSAVRRVLRPVVIRWLLLKERAKTGVVWNPLADSYHQDPNALYARLREKDPVHYSELLRGWVISRHEDVDAILRDHRRFSNDARKGEPYGSAVANEPPEGEDFAQQPSMLGLDPPDHTRLRALVSQAFTPRSIEAWRPRIEQVVDSLLDALTGAKRFDAIEALAVPVPIVVIAEMLGIPREDRAKFKEWSDKVARTLEPTITREQLQEALQAGQELDDYFDGIVRERAANPREDLISVLATAEEQGDRLTHQEVLATLALLLIAGNETTTNLIGNGLLSLLQHPDQMAWLQQHPEQIDVAVEEMLRYDSPVQTNGRTALEDVEVGGKLIKKGQQVVLLQGSANRDPSEWERPEALDLSRGDKGHTSFGRGIHYCLGAPLARLEAQIVFPRLLARFPNIHLAPGQKVEFRDNIVLRGLKRLPVEV